MVNHCELGNGELQCDTAVSQKCTCKPLEATDIPGAVLPRTPEKCKVNELRVWLKSRSQRVKTKETKSELVVRAKMCLSNLENLPVVDPHPGQPYLTKLKANCPSCNSYTATKEKEDKFDNASWTTKTEDIPDLSYLDILTYSKQSGKNTNYVEKPIDKGYVFFHDGYVFNEEVFPSCDCVSVRAKCYRSMKKNEIPHQLIVKLFMNGSVKYGNCTCVAGASGHCNHVYALLYSIDRAKRMKINEFTREKTCTDKKAVWTQRRTEGIRSEPVMGRTVVKPKYGMSSSGIRSTLYEARSTDTKESVNCTTTKSILASVNPLFGLCVTAGHETETVSTKMGFSVPSGSALSYQLMPTEANFSVCENIGFVKGKDGDACNMPNFPWGETAAPNIPQDLLAESRLSVTQEEANSIFLETKGQSTVQLWHSVRRHRLTASKFGAIVKRKKDKVSFIHNQIISPQNIGNLPAIKYGQENETKAVRAYLEYMNNTQRPVHFYDAGCVINPNFPWLAASPDGIIYDKIAGYGLIEVKCSYFHRNITPLQACSDKTFFCQCLDGNIELDKKHNYYAQIQGQLGICGAKFCDLIVYTNRGLGIQRITFDELFWATMTSKLHDFFVKDFLPIIRSM